MNKMNVLITGATGFLGNNATCRLLAEGHQVTALGRNEAAGRRLAASGARFVPIDLAVMTPELAAPLFAGQQMVIHCAALSSPWGAYDDFYQANVIATENVVRSCRAAGVERLIHVSTPSVYFDFREQTGITENSPLPRRSANAYAHTKRLAEAVVDAAFAEGLPVVTLRPRALFGPGDTAIFPRLMRANERGFVPLIGGGQALMDLTYIDNVTEALICCMRADAAVLGNKYNITNGEPTSLFELLQRIFGELGIPFRHRSIPYPLAYGAAGLMELGARMTQSRKEPLMTRYTVGTLAFSQTLDISRAARDLHYRPQVTVEEGIRRFCSWWRSKGEL
ncbi:NAD-dependent epimerase/dehydratase family protein [Paenibacillaceae bacterium]|nr:NAD-dependent epimerase/dehydratase family protein [Paenibacillaceae bacterium]